MSNQSPVDAQRLATYNVETYRVVGNGVFPNNADLPVIYYPQAVELAADDPAGSMAAHLEQHGWGYTWRNGIFPYHHYHSTAHEALGLAAGSAQVQLGGEGGRIIQMRAGDVIVIPAGVALRNVAASIDLVAVGAYPPGQLWDVNTGEPDERSRTDANIATLPLPRTDPIYGDPGPLLIAWSVTSR